MAWVTWAKGRHSLFSMINVIYLIQDRKRKASGQNQQAWKLQQRLKRQTKICRPDNLKKEKRKRKNGMPATVGRRVPLCGKPMICLVIYITLWCLSTNDSVSAWRKAYIPSLYLSYCCACMAACNIKRQQYMAKWRSGNCWHWQFSA